MIHERPSFRRTAIRYWERRRIIYNIALVPPALIGYALAAAISHVGDAYPMAYGYLLFWFAASALGANICYSFAYALEFLFGDAEPTSDWLRYQRTTAFVGGVLFAMLLAFVGGSNIAMMEYYHLLKLAR